MRWLTGILVILLAFGCTPSLDDLQNGDIIFQDDHSTQSEAIKLATGSEFSHVGLIVVRGGEKWVYEAHQSVQLTPLETFIARHPEKKFTVMRLKNAGQLLDDTALSKMEAVGERFNGKRYDQYFEWTDKKMYCSELVWKIYKEALDIELGEPAAIKTFDLDHKIVFQQLMERYGEVPIHLKVLPPSFIHQSELLEEVYSQ